MALETEAHRAEGQSRRCCRCNGTKWYLWRFD